MTEISTQYSQYLLGVLNSNYAFTGLWIMKALSYRDAREEIQSWQQSEVDSGLRSRNSNLESDESELSKEDIMYELHPGNWIIYKMPEDWKGDSKDVTAIKSSALSSEVEIGWII